MVLTELSSVKSIPSQMAGHTFIDALLSLKQFLFFQFVKALVSGKKSKKFFENIES